MPGKRTDSVPGTSAAKFANAPTRSSTARVTVFTMFADDTLDFRAR
jgi:hypothetical protein